MAQHNYFGFTTPVTQYAQAQQSYAPPPPQPTYVPTASQPTYATTGATAQRTYTYDAAQNAAYAAYNAQTTAPARPAVVTVAVTPQYQAVVAKPTYSNNYAAASTPRTVSALVNTVPATTNKTANYGFVSAGSQQNSYNGPSTQSYRGNNSTPSVVSAQNQKSSSSSYDMALYNAATSYYQQQQKGVNHAIATAVPANQASWHKKDSVASFSTGMQRGGYGRGRGGGGGGRPFQKKPFNPDTAQTHYCEICKISCAGALTYKEHLEGQKHKKKAAQQASAGKPVNMRAGQSQLRCDLCDVTCTGTDAYTAHIRGAKHLKTMNLHQKLGKPIPSSDPTVITAVDKETVKEAKQAPGTAKKVVPKMKFVGGTTLHSTAGGTQEVRQVDDNTAATVAAGDAEDELLMPGEKMIQPVGTEYVEEERDALGKLVNFNCKLCDCKFTDPNAKNMHLKGRRHRTNYKKKVDPSLIVDIKPNSRVKKIADERQRFREIREAQRKEREAENAAQSEMRAMEADRYGVANNKYYSDRIESFTDKHIVAKHAAIYPSEPELAAVQKTVSSCEKALKVVSDTLHQDGKPEIVDNKEVRMLKGVMRVGDLAKGLLLAGDLQIELIVLCSKKPTQKLIKRVYEIIPNAFKEIEDENYTYDLRISEASIHVMTKQEPKVRCILNVTSPLVREENTSVDDAESTEKLAAANLAADNSPPLDKRRCLDSLASLRHAKWFQAKASVIPSCVLILRVLKELRTREKKFAPIKQWAVELLLERCMNTAVSPMGPGDAMRRFFECLASGICLPPGLGLSDPCEREPMDVFSNLTAQQRENLTQYAQDCVRFIAFNQISQILDIELLPAELKAETANAGSRKRHIEEAGQTAAVKKEKN